MTKKPLPIIMCAFLFILCLLTPAASTLAYSHKSSGQQDPQNQDKEKKQEPQVREHVEVINVELVLRAILKGKTVANLKKEDITIYEDGTPVPITSFLPVKRKLGLLEKMKEEKKKELEFKTGKPGKPEKPKRRFFFLYFWVSEPDSKIKDALDMFFKQIYRENDFVMLMTKDRLFSITRKEQLETVLPKFNGNLKRVMQTMKFEKDQLFAELERAYREFRQQLIELEREGNELKLDRLIRETTFKIRQTWQQFKLRNITLAEKKFMAMARSMRHMNMEKWGMVFYQQDSFPLLNPKTIYATRQESMQYMEKLEREVQAVLREMRASQRANTFFSDIQQAFIQANVTFNLFITETKYLQDIDSTLFKNTPVHSDWQLAFRKIVEATGGKIIVNNKLDEALIEAVENEDVYYRLTYAPRSGGAEVRKLTIKPKKKKIKLHYHRTLTLQESGVVKIADFSFDAPVVSFKLKNYRQIFDGQRLYGDILLKVTGVESSSGQMMSFEKVLEPGQEETDVSLKLNFPTGGKYSLILEAADRQTGKIAIFSKKIDVPQTKLSISRGEPTLITETYNAVKGTAAENKLKAILAKADGYCRKLAGVTFYFICTEVVDDAYWAKGKQIKDDRYLFDYQIIMDEKGKMNESRKWLKPEEGKKKKKKRKKKKKKPEINPIPNFYANYPFLMPVSMLARENHDHYNYQLLGQETLNNRKVIKINVEPKTEDNIQTGAVYGVVWLDSGDGSVVKIQLHPFSFGGLQDLKKVARRKGTDLKITDIHWYDIQRKGIRFPSKTEISCAFLPRKKTGANDAFEQLKTVYTYQNYKFFNVNVDVTDSGHK